MPEYDDNWSFIEASMQRRKEADDARSLGRLEEINREDKGIYGPEHPRVLAGLRNVRNFGINDLKPFDFVAGGLLDVAEGAAWGYGSTPMQKGMAALEVGGAGIAGKLANKTGLTHAVGRGLKKIDEFMWGPEPTPPGKLATPEVYHNPAAEYDSVIDAIRENFGEGLQPHRQHALEQKAFNPSEMTRLIEKVAYGHEKSPMHRVGVQKWLEDQPIRNELSPSEHRRQWDEAVGRLMEPEQVFRNQLSPEETNRILGRRSVADEEWIENEAQRLANEPYEIDDITPYGTR